jgi:hypothetical protein
MQRSRSNIGKHCHYDKYSFSRFVYLIKRERNNMIDMMKSICIFYIMSQSDYIKRKRVASELKGLSSNSKETIKEGSYLEYKEFYLINHTFSDKLQYNKLFPSNSINVFGMQINNPTSCPSYFCDSSSNTEDQPGNTGPTGSTGFYYSITGVTGTRGTRGLTGVTGPTGY